ncbi:ABC transporter ATP-binding protein [Haladaptatus caseinilyticus]|uniref:ABC transporter ATP-binding protein n=1 Tax=Haladaptatus caseinilyticus TaxID=2993314 RepID=UPI00224B9B16|nr:ABC transporter ATP-binding protein [Haladaptatus caseinilyticus]
MTESGLAIDVNAAFTADGATFTVEADVDMPAGETLVVLGPSGSGKSLLLEAVAGFHDYDGSVSLDGRDMNGLPPEKRRFGFVFQEYALFPHLTVAENVSFGEEYHEETRSPDELLSTLGVSDLAGRYPETLSGGEKQRVALARALLVRPDAFLLDEPLSALDVPTRQSLREDLAELLADETAVYVTHDRTTAWVLADRIAVMRDGSIEQKGTPDAVFERPASSFVARFTGSNCLPHPEKGRPMAIRPEHVELGNKNPDVHARVVRVLPEDGRYRVVLTVGETRCDAYTTTSLDVGETIGVTFPGGKTHPLPSDDG